MFGRFVVEKREVVYRLGGVDPDEGVDVYDLVKYLNKFDDLMRATVREVGYDGELHIKVRPFREGSFITEFVIEGGIIDLFSGDVGNAIANAATILGFCIPAAVNLPKVVKAVRGRIDKHRKNDDGTYTYGEGDDAITVDETTHKVVQSKQIADLYSDVVVGPFVEFNSCVEQVNIYVRDDTKDEGGLFEGTNFTRDDAPEYAAYSRSAKLLDELNATETVSQVKGIWLRPVSGSYGGAEKGYTFSHGQGDDRHVYRHVSIADEDFREMLESGSVKFNAGDLLFVDLEMTQRLTKAGNMTESYRILAVHDYREVRSPRQATFDDYLESKNGDSGAE